MKRLKVVFCWLVGILIIALIAVFAIGKFTDFMYKESYPKKYSEYVSKYSQEFGIDENLVYSLIRSESAFNPNAVSEVNAKGLMQITEDTFYWAQSKMENPGNETYDDIFNPEVNIKYGVYILKLLIEEFENESTVLAAYHAGWGEVKKWLENPDYSSDGENIDTIPGSKTSAYVKSVLEAKANYDKIYCEEQE